MMYRLLCVLVIALGTSACGSLSRLPDDARTTTFEPRVDAIMNELTHALPIQQRMSGFQYVVWSSTANEGAPLVCDTNNRRIYIHVSMLSNDTDTLALMLGHEIGHAVDPGPGALLRLGGLGGSVGTGVGVGVASQWYWGLLAGVGFSALIATPIIYALSRENEEDKDAFGLTLMMKAGFNPDRAIHGACQYFIEADAALEQADEDAGRTHPMAAKRCRALKEEYESIIRSGGLAVWSHH